MSKSTKQNGNIRNIALRKQTGMKKSNKKQKTKKYGIFVLFC